MRNARLHPTGTAKKALSALILFLFSIGLANAQPRVRTGHVVDENGKPLAGVSVTVKGQKNGTTTDDNGNYQIQAEGNVRLVFSMIGFATREVNADESGTVSLAASRNAIDSVVVVGYGTMKKVDVTGSVTSVKA